MHEVQTFLWSIGFYWSLSLILVTIWVSLYPISWICWGAWGWVQDNERQECHNRVAEWVLLRVWGVSNKSYRRDEECYLWGGFLGHIIILLLLTLILYLSITFYEVTLFIVSIVSIMHLTRFAIRHRKLFDEHVKDKEAHK